ncbi:DinB family protein [Spongiimicrobium sp. 3-5]|uniref:DinB family protein n=1 Tax=Spongiimicrobium sp. 3-5 TaxID=3332596 RepID=UPI0039805252
MKKVILPIVLLAFVGFGVLETGLTDMEREFAIKEMSKTQDHLLSTVAGLSEVQLSFKPDSTAWSISECVEHLAISENAFDQMLQGSLQAPADPAKRNEVKMTDEQLLGIITDRSKKVKTRESFEPTGKFGSHEETLKAFTAKRAEHIEYVKSTEDELRYHYGQLPFGTIDAYQVLLFMSGHTERHIKQMEEVKAHENFPSE